MALDRVLSHPDITKLARVLERRPGVAAELYEGARFAAVAAMLRVGASEELEMFLVKRADYAGDPWSGHVALPGGRREEDDETLEGTAIREVQDLEVVDTRREDASQAEKDFVAISGVDYFLCCCGRYCFRGRH